MSLFLGDRYEGSFQVNKFHGQGRYVYQNGDTYEGAWKAGKKHGAGNFINKASGSEYVGNFKAGLEHGQGKLTFGSGSVYDGEWKLGRKVKGTHSAANGDVYEGEFKENAWHGWGVLRCGDGTLYEGSWKEHKMHGKGKLTYDNGEFYEGEFRDNVEQGESYSWSLYLRRYVYPICSIFNMHCPYVQVTESLRMRREIPTLANFERACRMGKVSTSIRTPPSMKESSRTVRATASERCPTLTAIVMWEASRMAPKRRKGRVGTRTLVATYLSGSTRIISWKVAESMSMPMGRPTKVSVLLFLFGKTSTPPSRNLNVHSMDMILSLLALSQVSMWKGRSMGRGPSST